MKAEKTITLTAYDAEHVYEWLRWFWRDEALRFGGCYECERLGRRLERLVGPAWVRRMSQLVNADRRKHGVGPQGVDASRFQIKRPAPAGRRPAKTAHK